MAPVAWLALAYAPFVAALWWGIPRLAERLDVAYVRHRPNLKALRLPAMLVGAEDMTLDDDLGGLA